jgi:hypothetical protein
MKDRIEEIEAREKAGMGNWADFCADELDHDYHNENDRCRKVAKAEDDIHYLISEIKRLRERVRELEAGRSR